MNYICKRCAYSTNIKCNLITHLIRKKQCKVVWLDIPRQTLLNELQEKITKVNTKVNNIVNNSVNKVNTITNICKYCGKTFSHKQSRHLHEKKFCKEKKPDNSLEKKEIAFMKQIIVNEKEEKDLLKKQIEILLTKIGNINTNNYCNNTTNNTINNNTNITNIQINGWGEEDLSHLTDKFYRFCYDRPFTSIPRVIEAVFFNPNCPKNWNVMIKDDKSSKALIYNKEKDAWLKTETNGVVEDLMHRGYGMLDANFDKQKDANKLTNRLIEKFTKFQDFYSKGDKQYEKRLTTEIKELLINYKAYHVIK